MVLPDLNFSPPEESDIPEEEGIPEVDQNAGTVPVLNLPSSFVIETLLYNGI
jgi:hypothetical protein